MTAAQWTVTVGGLAAIAWVYWYFFAAERTVGVAAGAGDVQRIRIEVKGGYTPAVVKVRAGGPVRLDFFRDETNSCTEEVVLPEFGIRTYLPAYQTTAVEFTPMKPGSFDFSCGMGMVHGRLIVEESAA